VSVQVVLHEAPTLFRGSGKHVDDGPFCVVIDLPLPLAGDPRLVVVGCDNGPDCALNGHALVGGRVIGNDGGKSEGLLKETWLLPLRSLKAQGKPLEVEPRLVPLEVCLFDIEFSMPAMSLLLNTMPSASQRFS
jgi:hypothetical protein